MPMGMGKYDDLCETAHVAAKATLTLLIIVGGEKGDGFTATCSDLRYLELIPGILRQVADDIEKTNNSLPRS